MHLLCSMEPVEQIIDIITVVGVFAFAISGALTAMEKKLDLFGVFIIAFATAVGGGSLRDVIIANRSVFWLTEPIYTYIIIGGTIFSILFRKKLGYLRTTLSLFDTIGLALYTIIGVKIGIQNDLSGVSCIALGTITGAFGGVIRDILVNDVPMIFQKEVYATISIFGGSLYFVLHNLGMNGLWVELLAIFIIIILRSIVVHFEIKLPTIYSKR
ncbi:MULTISPECIES: trimeric intracellular cation channel family protein [unclassified Lentimicrobium]|uniref:trimeric intracellular cation channel family protein n=1 Tax=unclassified Lentimicrobium TaxID=2677434 RepID=UPI001C12FFAC|nr:MULTISPECIES: trimeric intracellular cation channel family protein [unclassified Lentimicrobium]